MADILVPQGQVDAISKSIAALNDIIKGNAGKLKTHGEKLLAVENQLADALEIINSFKKERKAVPIFGADDPSIAREWLFKDLKEGMPQKKAVEIVYKALATPFKEDECMKEWQEYMDKFKLYKGYFGKDPVDTPIFGEYEIFLEKSGLKDALSVAGSPANFIPEGWSSEILQYYQQELMVATLFDDFEMPQNPFYWKILGTGFSVKLHGEPTQDPSSKITSTKHAQTPITFNAKTLAGRILFSDDLEEDELPAYVPTLRDELIPRAMAEAKEDALVNGDTAGTHQDTAVTDADDPRKAVLGLRAIAADESAEYNVQTGGSAFAYSDFAEVLKLHSVTSGDRSSRVNFGVRVNEGGWVMSNKTYLSAIAFDEVETADKINLPTNINGVVNVIYGRPVVVSQFYPDTMNSSGRDTGAGTTGGFVHVNRRQFRIGNRRPIEVTSFNKPEELQKGMVVSHRFDFQRMLAAGNIVVAAGINVP